MSKFTDIARSRDQIAKMAAADIPNGWYVNLGIGIPTLISNNISKDKEIILHSENGILGMGPVVTGDDIDKWNINAGKEYISILPGGSFFHHADSFSIIRGHHLNLCVLGAYQVAVNGDIANWAKSEEDKTPAVGGAMDLSVGAQNIWVLMNHLTRNGEPRILESCTYPVTAIGVVKKIYTDLATFHLSDGKLYLENMVDGISFNELQGLTGCEIHSQ